MEGNLSQNMPFDERQPLKEDDLAWETTFDGKCPLMEDTL